MSEEYLNELGAEGWKLRFHFIIEGSYDHWYYMFTRPK